MVKQVTNTELDKEEQKLIALAIAAIGLLEASKPARTTRDYLKIGVFGLAMLFSILQAVVLLIKYLADFRQNFEPSKKDHLTKENLEEIYDQAPLIKARHHDLVCFDKNAMRVDYREKKSFIDFHAKEIHSHSSGTCKEAEKAALNCEKEARFKICQNLQKTYCDLPSVDNLVKQIDLLLPGVLTGSVAIAIVNLAFLLKFERDRLRLTNSSFSAEGLAQLKLMGSQLQITIDDNANINDLIGKFKKFIDKLRNEMAGAGNPYKLFSTPTVIEIKDEPQAIVAWGRK